ncbi:MAG: hypothetical protein NUW24_11035 [Anaerolineae bacterium]|jgi:hypothetical protein|nr:hypothetical protein [Anaerolineae bacterium]MDH7475144.1 hypothetical protein [Anaerolineae bacterium]
MSEQSFQTVSLRVALDRAIARKSDEYDGEAQRYADQLKGTKLDKTQVRGLETLASTTDKVSDITDWLKLRVGRDSERKGWAKEGIGRDLLTTLEGLRGDAGKIVAELPRDHATDPDLERQVHLRLCREFLKHLAAHFEYLKAERE